MQRVEGYMSRAEQLRLQLDRSAAPRAVAATADTDKCVGLVDSYRWVWLVVTGWFR